MPSFLLSFELNQERDCLSIRADEIGLRRLSEMLLHVLDKTKVGDAYEEVLNLPDDGKHSQPLGVVSNVKVCCSRGENREA
ncbi:MAG: hypothetical protein JWM68_2894 [Verrucomicrobiales bacterium]|nr:hypothetical protein [Verrucomicrobiales bacterium]